MFKIVFEDNIQELVQSLEKSQPNVMKHINWYINQVYRDLSKQHGRSWTYVTPPGNKRKNLYKRSGRLLSDLKNAKYATKNGDSTYEAGFQIRPGSYLWAHEGARGDPPTVISSLGRSDVFLGKMTIPLRAALNADGTPKIFTARTLNNILILPFKTLHDGHFSGKSNGLKRKPMNNRKLLSEFKRGKLKVDFSGEDIHKFHEYSMIVCKKSGSRLIPLYVLAKEIKLPKRLFIREKMDDYVDNLYNRLQSEIDKYIK